jgi:hypothetical protein
METKITVLVSEELRRQAKAEAALQGRTLSEVIRDALEEFVQEGKESRQTMLASEPVLSRAWNTPEEDAAWAGL